MNQFVQSRAARWLALLLFAAMWFSTLGYRKVITPDEGRYAEIAREMVVSGDWLTPRLNGIKYFEKPALQYWATAASYSVLGQNEFAARLWTGLTGFAAVLFAFFVSRKLWGERVGLTAAMVLGSCTWWMANGHFNSLDMGVSAFMSIAMGAFMLAQRDAASKTENRNYMLLCWAAMGLAVLSKGLIGIVLPGAVLVLYSLINLDARLWLKLHIGKGLLLLLLITAPWFVAVSQANSEFAYFFFIHEHFQRFLTTEHHRTGAWWYFVPYLLAGLMPWLSVLPQALRQGWAKSAGEHFQPNRFLLIWAVFIFVFFSRSDSKLPSYILPIFPALAMLSAQVLTRLSSRALRWHLGWLALPGMATLVAAPMVARLSSEKTPQIYNAAFAGWLIPAGIVLLATALISFWLANKGRNCLAIAVTAGGALLGLQLPMLGHESYAHTNSAYYLAQDMQKQITPQTTLYAIGYYDQSLPFYLKRTLQFVEYTDEFAMGQKSEPDKFMTLDAFTAHWNKEPQPMAVVSKDIYQQLQQRGLPMRVAVSDPRRTVIVKP
ncbi:glycosyltransferase family 39 protein [Amantichitinum ursilacus]|uniref:Undecaprenyl phosphate-alpha-4-amino-4-deoxy-L-arabinose arabinosyl transferase n=1 Tax=Amantichitinum ursilacus TaxID=857265 RepID=A0A0N0GQU4_9NEIS|nr:glycosyltransferase family 39 protein [Amantichitinum ursilacus]KPC55058.1 Undecaprenyl phosphate-alpha-4-amino-4-deoxy-L-arabinose arabinosyl transferase [Amantichitinum ursilacus]